MKGIKYNWFTAMIMLVLSSQVSCTYRNPNIYPLDKGYLNQTTLNNELNSLVKESKGLATLSIIGRSGTEKLPVQLLTIKTPKSKHNVLLIGQHHGDEVLGVEIVMEFARQLINNYSKDKKIKAILDEFAFYIIPTVNPEGYRVVTSGIYSAKRKNNRDTNHDGKLEIATDGVDLNRNYPIFWQEDEMLPSAHNYYKGTAPMSEPEIAAVVNLANEVRFEYAIFYHSSVTGTLNEKLYLPWHSSKDKLSSERFSALKELAELYAALVPRDYLQGNYLVYNGLSSKVGNARNFFFHSYNTNAFLVEVGGLDKKGFSVVHPSNQMMRKNRQKHSKALITYFYNLVNY